MKAQSLKTLRTARFFSIGELNEKTQEVWIVLHGFAQLASEFLQIFEPLLSQDKFIVAPEALNRFYTKGYSGKVGATWMTKEAREHDIEDNVEYLNNLVQALQLNTTKTKVVVLAFSQGVATLTRWLNASHFVPNVIIMYAGEMAHELKTKPLPAFFHHSKCYFIYGNKDPLIPAFAPATLSEIFAEIDLKIIDFEGAHEINIEALRQVKV